MAGSPTDDATGLALLVRSGAVHPRELVEAAIDRIEAIDPTLNSVIHRQFERARRDADGPLPDGPFRGVPFLFKDFNGAEAGEPHHQGMRALRDAGWRAQADSPFALRTRSAGLIPLGRTNVPELALMGTTEPAAYGPTRNPWDLERSPGGSSGGSAAAVAAGLVPAAHANDIAGSIRIPSAQCGLVGLKPTRGRAVIGRPATDPAVGMNSEGVITRTMRDAAGLLDALTDTSGAGPWPAPRLPGPLTAELGRDPGRLRIAVWTQAFNGADVDEGCAAAARRAASLLSDLGHTVEETAPDALSEPDLQMTTRVLLGMHAANEVEAWSHLLGRPLGEDDLEPASWAAVEEARRMSSADALRLQTRQQELTRAALSWWRDHGGEFDLLVTPTTAEPAPPVGAYKAGYRPGRASAFTRVFNATGQPALSLPLGVAGDGLPRGVQFVAGYGREDLLVRVGSLLESVDPWESRRPPVHA